MQRTNSIILAAILAAFLGLPGWALADPPADPGGDHAQRPAKTEQATPPSDAPAAEKAKAYGKLCQGESKKHVAGEKGTSFSRCVTAMAKLASGETDSPKTACKPLSKKHVRGEKGTPYSRCIVAAAKLRKAQDED
jgi:hypothetical protein